MASLKRFSLRNIELTVALSFDYER